MLFRVAVIEIFNQAISGQGLPRWLSFDHEPPFAFHRWQANLRILGIAKVRYVPYAPVSHPFEERLIGTVRREYLDRLVFWSQRELERQLADFRSYYNAFGAQIPGRSHIGGKGRTCV